MIEDLIYKKLCSINSVAEQLVSYNDQPAVFYLDAANDKDEAWKEKMFPRMDYYIDWRADAERQTSGTLYVSVWCSAKNVVQPEDFIKPITDEVNNCFYRDESGVYCTVWNQNYPFKGNNEKLVTNGVTIGFDIMAFPNQQTNEPDPVLGMQHFIKNGFETCLVLELDGTDEIFKASAEQPVIYVRVAEVHPVPSCQTYSVCWMRCEVNVHLFVPDIPIRNVLLKSITQHMSMQGECVLTDKSPMFFRGGRLNLNADPLKVGQISMTCEYGVLPETKEFPKIQDIIITNNKILL